MVYDDWQQKWSKDKVQQYYCIDNGVPVYAQCADNCLFIFGLYCYKLEHFIF